MNALNSEDGLRARQRGEGYSRANRHRRSFIAATVTGLLTFLVTLVIGACNVGSKVVAETVRHVGPPIARAVTFLVLLGAFVLAVAHYGAIGLDRGLGYAHGAIQTAHKESNDFVDRIWALVPRFEPSHPVPRATPVEEPTPIPPPVTERLASVIEGALFPRGSNYPSPAGYPPLEGDVLAKAGGHDVQDRITDVVGPIAFVESTDNPDAEGDKVLVNGVEVPLAFGLHQVRHEPCEDIQRVYGIKIDPRACLGNPELSEYAIRLYLGYWAKHYESKGRRLATPEILCTTWNCGPDRGPAAKAAGYWKKFARFFPEAAQLAAR